MNGVEYSSQDGAAQLDVSQNGTLVYRASRPGSDLQTVQWLDPAGHVEPLLAAPGDYRALRLSPDGTRLALEIGEGSTSDIYVYDILQDQQPTRLTAGAGIPNSPLVWSRDGRYIFFHAMDSSWWIPSDVASTPKRLIQSFRVSGVTADGREIFLTSSTAQTGETLTLLP